MSAAYILAAVRTPGGKAKKGKLKDVRPDDLAALAIRALLERTRVDPALVEDVLLGCAFPEGEAGMNVARVAALKAGLPVSVPGQTINRFCASGLQTIASAAERILAGGADCLVAGGTESMSMIPMGGQKFSANPGLAGSWPESYASMGITAELVAERHHVGRADQDAFAAESHRRAAAAQDAGRFDAELVPVEVESVALKDGTLVKRAEVVRADEGVRRDTTAAGLGALRPAFKVDGSVTAGNSSQMTDGAAAVLVVSEAFLKRAGVKPLARFVAFSVRGVAPEVMGLGPVEAIPAALARAGLTVADVASWELNEAFAAQALAVVRALGLDPARVNPNGGAIALGHPLGCTGAKLTATLLGELGRSGGRYGVVSMCVGGGMGAAGIFERV
ncbi:MAG: acetyl-CoA C-acyltransferase [Anaeromyxobacter sp.]|nr:acetyl-CoA C-acyltransferase [Anaeromyxobacter sp.]MBL0276714.1 acetyl-CoA C-acyltransferase [Anaeromyxobacter sp.]